MGIPQSEEKLRRKNHLPVIVFIVTLFLALGQLQASSSAEQTSGSYLVGTIQGSYSNKWGTYKVTIYYPALQSSSNAQPNKAGAPYPAILFAPGFGANKDFYKWVGNQLASWGYVVAIFTAPNTLSSNVAEWSDGISSGITYVNERSSSGSGVLSGMVDSTKIGAMGHSMGGAGAILATAGDSRIKATVSLAPANSKLGSFVFTKALEAAKTVGVPVQIQVGSADRMTPKNLVHEYYVNIPAGLAKEYIEIKGGGHVQFLDSLSTLLSMFDRGATLSMSILDRGTALSLARQHEISALFFTAWFQYFLYGQLSFATYIFGANAQNALATGVLSALEYVKPS